MTAGAGPLFKQIAQSIGDAIEMGSIAVGEMLPTEKALALRYGASRHTIRDALSELRALGLVESRQGKGTAVVKARRQSTYAQSYSSIEELTRIASGTPIHLLQLDDVIADMTLAGDLHCGVGQSFVRILGLRYGENDTASAPVGYVEVYIDASFGRIRAHLQNLKISIAETLERLYNLQIFRIEQEISVVLLPDAIAAHLQVATGTPAMLIRRRYAAENGRVVETAFSYYSIGQFEYRNVLLRNK